MRNLIMVLRVIHIFSGVFWVGFSFFNVSFMAPAIAAVGAEGQKVMGYLTQKTSLLSTVYVTATLTMLSGVTMYWILSGLKLSFLRSGYGLILTIGGLAGIVAWVIGFFVIRGIFNRMQSVSRAIAAAGGPPSPEQAGTMQSLVAQLGTAGQVGVVFMVVALLGMSIAQYSPF
jgi:uncharacterized membrane protein